MNRFVLIGIATFLTLVGASIVRSLFSFEPPVAPVPEFLSFLTNQQVSSLDVWLPSFDKEVKSSGILDISAKSALVYDLTTQRTLFEKNPKDKLPIASLTKVMTAIIALENPVKNDRYLVKKDALVGENTMGLTEGEVLTLEELLYGLILTSGNDAAEVLADSYSLGRAGFIRAMNDKAKSLGLSSSNFTNPSGLEGDGKQYSTAYDLLVITQYALKFGLFRKVAATFQEEIPYTQSHKYFFLENETNLLSSYPGVKGVKTGFTPEAGLCLITYLEYEGHQIIAILLGSSNRRQEMKNLLDYSLKTLGVIPPPHG